MEVGDEPLDQIAEAVQLLLSGPDADLVVRIETRQGSVFDEGVISLFASRFGSDTRVRFAPAQRALDEFPVSPFHVRIAVAPGSVAGAFRELQRRLLDRVSVTIKWGSGGHATIERAWALHRAGRTGRPVDTFGDIATMHLRNAPVKEPGKLRRWTRCGWDVHRVLVELTRVRGLLSAWHFVRWLVAAVWWRWGRRV